MKKCPEQRKRTLIPGNVHYVCWYLTYKCNLACPFCYAFKNGNEPSRETLLDVGDSLVHQGIKKINLIGGEPFLCPHILAVVDRYWQTTAISVTTNGTLLSDDTVVKLQGRIERFTVSLDTTSVSLGLRMRGPNYNVKAVMRAIRTACRTGIRVKINTVVTSLNHQALSDIGMFIRSLDSEVVWKLFQLTDNPNVQIDLSPLQVHTQTFAKLVSDLSHLLPGVAIVGTDSKELSSSYVIITPAGDIHIPMYENYQALANVRSSNIVEVLEARGFDFQENRQVYEYAHTAGCPTPVLIQSHEQEGALYA
jgi:MoaA/NifB/PqqE/SkfB family radical SAM enzyme